MTRTRHIIIGLMMLLGILTCCHKTKPQLPSYKSGRTTSNTDEQVLQLLELNRHLAEEADRQLVSYAKKGYILLDNGCWVKGLIPAESPLQTNETVHLWLRTYTLNDALIEDRHCTLTVGQSQEIEAVNAILTQMQHRSQISLIAPWYQAYGATGSEQIPPYTNIRIEIQID